jgi:hypothetical protein
VFHIFHRPSGQRDPGIRIIAGSPPMRFCLPGQNLHAGCWQASFTMKLHATQIFKIISTSESVRGDSFGIAPRFVPRDITTGMMV